MATREEIREAIDLYTDGKCLYPDKACVSFKGSDCLSDEEAYKCLMRRLGEIGVVIRVERESPLVEFTLTGHMTPSEVAEIGGAYRKAYAGYEAVESLI